MNKIHKLINSIIGNILFDNRMTAFLWWSNLKWVFTCITFKIVERNQILAVSAFVLVLVSQNMVIKKLEIKILKLSVWNKGHSLRNTRRLDINYREFGIPPIRRLYSYRQFTFPFFAVLYHPWMVVGIHSITGNDYLWYMGWTLATETKVLFPNFSFQIWGV